MYSKMAMDHFLRPRYARALAGPGVATGRATNGACGDTATFFVREVAGTVEVGFQCQGCAGAIAACSAAAEAVAGRATAGCHAPDASELAALLAPWPAEKAGCTAMAAQALALAMRAAGVVGA